MSRLDSEKAAMAVLVSNLLIKQAIESRARTSASVWLPHSFEEAEANANLFAKTQLPISDPERKRNLIRAYDRVRKSRETYSTRRAT